MLVVTEAGGQITQMDGTPLDVLHNCSVFASNGACRSLIEEVKPYLA
jgi:fructose-1,6-bisphosphatase/inositol monophosphatase family enzyme